MPRLCGRAPSPCTEGSRRSASGMLLSCWSAITSCVTTLTVYGVSTRLTLPSGPRLAVVLRGVSAVSAVSAFAFTATVGSVAVWVAWFCVGVVTRFAGGVVSVSSACALREAVKAQVAANAKTAQRDGRR
ncbi:hypothetical protein PT2222_290020 [Paraburkholderia tropica]